MHGFTLIELLAVIIILAVIALIATPIILNVVDNAKERAFRESVNGLLSASRNLYVEKKFEGDFKSVTFNYENGLETADVENYFLSVSGQKPKGGYIRIDIDGTVDFAISDGKYCATNYNNNIEISTDLQRCNYVIPPDECFTYSDGVITEFNNSLSNCSMKRIIIPNKINEDRITKIGQYAFREKGLTGVKISNGITEIGSSAFNNSSNRKPAPSYYNQISDLQLPNSLVIIGNSAFWANNLENVKIPSSVIEIGGGAFQSNKLKEVIIPEGVKKINYWAFSDNQITNLVLPNSIVDFSTDAFNNNQLPDDQAFIYARNSDGTIDYSTIVSYGGARRDNVVIPSTKNGIELKNIGYGAFRFNRITSIIIPDSVIMIDGEAFSGNRLKTIELPQNLKRIGRLAFNGNILGEVTIPSSVTYRDPSAFDHYFTDNGIGYARKEDLSADYSEVTDYKGEKTEVIIPKEVNGIQVKTIGRTALGENKLTSVIIPEGVVEIKDYGLWLNELTSIILPSTLEKIGENAFYSNKITNVIIPASVTTIGKNAFIYNQFPNALAITIEGESTRFDSIWNSLGFPYK